MKTETLLRERIEEELRELGNMKIGSDEYVKGAESISKLMTQLNDSERIKLEEELGLKKLESEEALRMVELETDKKDRKIRNGLTLFGIVSSGAILIWGTIVNWKYEKDGYIPSTSMGKMFVVDGLKNLMRHK